MAWLAMLTAAHIHIPAHTPTDTHIHTDIFSRDQDDKSSIAL